MKILYLTNLLPYPANTGGKINTYTKLKTLKQYQHEVDLLSFYEEEENRDTYEAHMKQYCRDVFQVYNRLTTADHMGYMIGQAARSLFSRYSLGVYKFYSKEMAALLEKLAQSRQYDCVYYGHLQLFVYQPIIKKLFPKARTVLDQHNCEAVIMERMRNNQRNPLKKAFLALETEKLKQFEVSALKAVDKTIVLSEADLTAMKGLVKADFPNVIIPNRVVEEKKVKCSNTQRGSRLRILFVGTMTWIPNNEGIIWFLENVYNRLEAASDDYELTIIGKNPSTKVQQLAEACRHATVTGYVDSVDPYYDSCDVLIVPLFIGGGQRVKIIEAFSRKMPVVSTTIGAEGLRYTDGKSILIADDPEAFCRAIEKMKDEALRSDIAENARRIYEETYSNTVIGRNFNQVLEDLMK